MLSRDQRLLRIRLLMESKPMVIACEAELGINHVPSSLSDFDSNAPDTLDRCTKFLNHIIDCCAATLIEIERRPRAPKQRTFEDEKAAREKVAKGDKEGREKAVALLQGKDANAKTLNTNAQPTASTAKKKKAKPLSVRNAAQKAGKPPALTAAQKKKLAAKKGAAK